MTSRGVAGKVRDNLADRRESYMTMERKGFRVTKDIGCMIPDDHFCTHGDKDIFKGYQRAFFCLHGFMPQQFKQAELPKGPDNRDLSAQLSHRCHRRQCCRIDHLCFEGKWRNFGRNFCEGPMTVEGPRFSGLDLCGCLLQHAQLQQADREGPPCLKRYTASSDVLDPAIPLCSSEEEVEAVLARTNFPLAFAFVDYLQRDQIGKVRQARKQGKRQALETIEEVSPVAKRRLAGGRAMEVELEDDLQFGRDPAKLFLCEDEDD